MRDISNRKFRVNLTYPAACEAVARILIEENVGDCVSELVTKILDALEND